MIWIGGDTMKRLLMTAMAALLLTACGSTTEDKIADKKPAEEKPTVEKPAEQKVTLSETKASFTDVTVDIEKAYLKGDTLILETIFTNDSYEGEIPFSTGAYIEVKKGDVMLGETSGVMEGNKGDYFFKNKKGVHTPVKFEYKLPSKDDVNIRLGAKRSDDEPVDITATIE